ncbi:MAG TPA: hypothetical protein VGO67_19330 [Verrucomicrobiae bacterium]|jgi:hypothetical protein
MKQLILNGKRFRSWIIPSLLLITLIGLTECCPIANAQIFNILSNGGFEVPEVQLTDPQPTSVLSGWVAGGNGDAWVVVNNPPALPAYEGNQFIALHPSRTPTGATLSQTFQTSIGQVYYVSFATWTDFDGSPESSQPSITASLMATGGSVLTNYLCAPKTPGWTNSIFVFTATAATTSIILEDTSANNLTDIALDEVIVASPPTLSISQTNAAVNVSWPATLVPFQLQASSSVDGEWTLISANSVTNTGPVVATIPLSSNNMYFRLVQQ